MIRNSRLPVTLQRATLKRLDDAFRAFFRRVRQGVKPGFPRFRSEHRFNSFGFRQFQGISFSKERLRFKGMPGTLRVRLHRPIPANAVVKRCTFKRDVKGWCVGFDAFLPDVPLRNGCRGIGVDLGISTFAVLSDGNRIPNPRFAQQAHRELRRVQRALARKKVGSKCRHKARNQVRRCHAATARCRSNYLHQESAKLVLQYDAIAIEALRIKPLAQSALAKSVHDVAWAKFISFLRYKAAKAGTSLIEVDPRNTTQNCSACGTKTPKGLADRWHSCKVCGLSIDRDLNAARNILNRAGVGPGLRNVAEFGQRAGGNLGFA